MSRVAVVAIGGNSLIRDEQHVTVQCQYEAVCETAGHIVDMIEDGWNVVVTHGNGPQVGYILRRSEVAHEHEGMHFVPLVSCVADTQGAIGYHIQQALQNEFRARGIGKQAVTVVTQVLVDRADPAFASPSKPIGNFYTAERADCLKKDHPDWQMIFDAGRGYRRVVPSPLPVRIVEEDAIKALIQGGFCVVGVGGGGIPVVATADGMLGVDAVIDKDFASALLASHLEADLFVISTGVEKVYVNFGKPDQRPLDRITAAEARRYLEEGH
ncbi:MAG: carbamate kinase, partial [Deltaproteobacteria bacterium]|nr:carbamate kinase [Deltaproteobacteria bacterium]